MSRQGKFDRVFCAIDRDSHQNFDEAINLANGSKKIGMIVSYPCFEFWLLLHFVGFTRKPYAPAGSSSAADLVIKDLCVHSGLEKYDKGADRSIFQLLMARLIEARKIAPKILAEAIASGEMNPSTQLHELLDYFEKLSSPQQVE
ncbi:MAG: RloB family protein [Methylococcales bacterium]|nr:RloB family protein [Methylococcales bacterium]